MIYKVPTLQREIKTFEAHEKYSHDDLIQALPEVLFNGY